ncbi:uncharacterized protein LOC124461761 [Drosophila willistoni]|uniref:uncharacterized protein LOC124461761 n=1 Tax=Drosophila willistoni TaxID=7260 RepID=UPI001F0861E7|nr:uncharacterized protein LOC124461761 [Drosophila willistoni]
MVLVRINAKVIGRHLPVVARCYLALASQRLLASIGGGIYREVFRGKTISVNANPSRDLSLSKNSLQYLHYEWTCGPSKKQNPKICENTMKTNIKGVAEILACK